MKAYLAFASLVQFNSANIGVALEVLKMAAVVLVMLLPILHHEASSAVRVRALYN